MTYDDRVKQLADRYEPKALALLGRIRDMLAEIGLVVDEPGEMHTDSYNWTLIIGDPRADNCVDISIEIAEQREYEGEGTGLNFGLDIVERGGRILGGLQPYNYTDNVWVDAFNDEAVVARWQLLDEADISQIPELLKR